MAFSTASSSRLAELVTMRSASTSLPRLFPASALERQADQFFGGVCTGTGGLEQARCFGRTIAPRNERAECLRLGARSRIQPNSAARRAVGGDEPIAHLHQQPL